MSFLSKHGTLFQMCWASAVPPNLKRSKDDWYFLKLGQLYLCNVLQYRGLWFIENRSQEQSKCNVLIVFSISDFYHSWTWLFLSVSLSHHHWDALQKFSPGNRSRSYSWFCSLRGAFCGALGVLLLYLAPWSPTAEARRNSWSHRRYSVPADLLH